LEVSFAHIIFRGLKNRPRAGRSVSPLTGAYSPSISAGKTLFASGSQFAIILPHAQAHILSIVRTYFWLHLIAEEGSAVDLLSASPASRLPRRERVVFRRRGFGTGRFGSNI
jgi:hypothetical protein